jgi:membrane fusion protein (multidrug efflux system)
MSDANAPLPEASVTPAASTEPAAPSSRKLLPRLVLLAMLVALVAGAAYYWTVYRFFESTDNAYVKAEVTWVMPRVSGEVTRLDVQANQTIKAGQVLMQLDDRDLQARSRQAEAVVQIKQAALGVQNQTELATQAAIAEAQASLAGARAEADRLAKELARYQSLLRDGVTTRQRVEAVQAQYLTAQAQVNRAQSGIAAAQAQYQAQVAARGQLQADLDSARANVDLIQVDAGSSAVVAPVSGTVGSLGVRLGSRVTPQTRLLAIVPMDTAYIEANFKETQIAKMRVGQQVEIHLDAYPDQVFHGRISSFSPASGAEFSLLPPDNATGNFNKVVQRLPVRISIDDLKNRQSLRPGLSATVRVDLRSGA